MQIKTDLKTYQPITMHKTFLDPDLYKTTVKIKKNKEARHLWNDWKFEYWLGMQLRNYCELL